MTQTSDYLPSDAPQEVVDRLASPARVPTFDPTLGIPVSVPTSGDPRNRLVAIGDSLTHGFQSGAVFNTDLSWPAIVTHELGWDGFRFPRYPGMGGIPLNVEFLLRDFEERYGESLSAWEAPRAVFRAWRLLDQIEDYWERGPGSISPNLSTSPHALAVYGWDIRDALSKTAATCSAAISAPNDDLLSQVIENNAERAAQRVYPQIASGWNKTLFEVAKEMGDDRDPDTDSGIETLVVFLGANNALQSVTNLDVTWSEDADFAHPSKKNKYTVWRPHHFAAELALVADQVRAIRARHVIWCTVPHVTIAPIARGVGGKVTPGSRYYPYYTRPWIDDDRFDPVEDPHITATEARAVDCAIDMYNEGIEKLVRGARRGIDGVAHDWYLLDLCGYQDRLASRRYIDDPASRPDWWTPYELPPELLSLNPVPDSRFLTGDGEDGRATGGLFSLDGVHPTTVGYGILAQEVINVMSTAGVSFEHPDGSAKSHPISVDFDRLIARDSLIETPPQNLTQGLEILGWADEAFDWVKRALSFRI